MSEEQAMKEMPKYKCHKEVYALKIKAIELDAEHNPTDETEGSALIYPEEEGYAAFQVDREYVLKHEPEVGGYYVVYENGYKSWSPAEAFEEGYNLIN